MYLLYIIAVVTFRVTSADPITGTCNPAQYDFPSTEHLTFLKDEIVMEFMRETLKLSEDETGDMMKKCGESLPEDRILSYIQLDTEHMDTASAVRDRYEKETRIEIVEGINNFAAKLFKAVIPQKWQSSAFSPYIVYASLLYAGASATDETMPELRKTLGLPIKTIRYNYAGHKNISDSVNKIDSSILKLSFKYFYGTDSKFQCYLTDYFGTINEDVDFESIEEAKNQISVSFINKAVPMSVRSIFPKQTILDLINRIDAKTNLVITNVGYFHGTLARGLVAEEYGTEFHKNDDPNLKSIMVTYNYGIGKYRYGELPDIDASFIELPIKTSDSSTDLSFLVILPNAVGGCANVIKKFHSIDIKKILQVEESQVEIRIPKIRFKSMTKLHDTLNNLGLRPIHLQNGGSEFDFNVDISNMYQRTIIEVVSENTLDIEKEDIPLEPNNKIIKFHVKSSYIYAVVLKKPEPMYLFYGQSK